MPKIISKRGRPEHPEIDIEVNLDELEGEMIVVTGGDATEDGQLVFEYYKEDWVIQAQDSFIKRMRELGCWVLNDVHDETWRIFHDSIEVAMVTETAVQSDLETIERYVSDTIDFIKGLPT